MKKCRLYVETILLINTKTNAVIFIYYAVKIVQHLLRQNKAQCLLKQSHIFDIMQLLMYIGCTNKGHRIPNNTRFDKSITSITTCSATIIVVLLRTNTL